MNICWPCILIIFKFHFQLSQEVFEDVDPQMYIGHDIDCSTVPKKSSTRHHIYRSRQTPITNLLYSLFVQGLSRRQSPNYTSTIDALVKVGVCYIRDVIVTYVGHCSIKSTVVIFICIIILTCL